MAAVPLLCGIIGHPLGHSLSPELHTWAFAQLGVPGAYLAWDTPADGLADLIRAVRTLRVHGLSVTIPHKEAVMALTDERTPLAEAVGAANTLYWENGRLVAHNTDVAGFVAPLRDMRPAFCSGLVLGSGGAARAAAFGMRELGMERITVCGRDKKKAALLAQAFNGQSLAWEDRTAWLADQGADLVVNATPLGMQGAREEESAFTAQDFRTAPRPGVAYDLVYAPLRTRFLEAARQAGWRPQSGLAMFAGQAVEQSFCWTGRRLALEKATAWLTARLAAQV